MERADPIVGNREDQRTRRTARRTTPLQARDLAPWVAVCLVAALLRFHQLGATPLSPSEARESLAALSILGGGPASSGLLLGANRLLFWLTGSSDTTARLVPALAGTLLPLTVWLLARQLGRRSALIGACLLAVSPSVVFLSRTASGDILGVTATLTLLGALLRYRASGDRRYLLAAGAALGLGMASGATFFGTLPPLILALAVARPPELRGCLRELGSRRPLLMTAAVAVLGSTAFLFYPAGLGVVADGFVAWLAGFGFDLSAVARTLGILVVYELIVLVFGLSGLIWALRRGDRLSSLLAFWALLSLGIALLRPNQPDAPLGPVVPLALLAGLVLDTILSRAVPRQQAVALLGGATAGITLVGAHGLVSLGQYARYAASNPERAQASLLLVGMSAVLLAGAVALLWTYSKWVAVGGLCVALAMLMTVYGWGKAWELGHTHQSDPRELWVEEATAPGARILAETLASTSEKVTGSSHIMPLTIQVDDPVLRWYLRDFDDVRWTDTLDPAVVTEAVVTPVDQGEPVLGDNYLGMDLVLRVQKPVETGVPAAGTALRWILLRDAPLPSPTRQVILWIRQDVAVTGASGSE